MTGSKKNCILIQRIAGTSLEGYVAKRTFHFTIDLPPRHCDRRRIPAKRAAGSNPEYHENLDCFPPPASRVCGGGRNDGVGCYRWKLVSM